jgi:two-component system, OmpR family, sensor kinase
MSSISLRTRLLIATSVVALLALVIADVTVYTSLQSYLYSQIDTTLEIAQQSLQVVANPPPPASPSGSSSSSTPDKAPTGASFCAGGRESAPGMFIEVIGSNRKSVDGDKCPAFTAGNKSYSPNLTTVVTAAFRANSFDSPSAAKLLTVPSTVADGPLFRVRVSRLMDDNYLVVADPLSGISNTLGQLRLVELSVTGGALIVSVLLGLWLVRVGLRPLRDVVRTAEAISEGDLVHRVPNANAETELGHVAMALNIMLERIEAGFVELQTSENRLRQFVSDASHELRTPIAAVSAYAQLFKYGALRDEAEMDRVMAGIENETSRMGRLVEDLLLLARFDERKGIDPEFVELVGLTLEAAETARILGPEWPVAVVADDVVEVLGDPMALRQVIDNLLKNVRAHTPSGTQSTVHVYRENGEAVIELEDEGPGFPEGDAKWLFERFVRADSSRSRDTGGAGLGLAIVSTIVKAHGGHVEAHNGAAGGAVFRIVLPLLAKSEPRNPR